MEAMVRGWLLKSTTGNFASYKLQVGAGMISAFLASAVCGHFAPDGAAWKWILGFCCQATGTSSGHLVDLSLPSRQVSVIGPV